MRNEWVKELSDDQLLEMYKVFTVGVRASAEVQEDEVDLEEYAATNSLCHKSPPKGYPENKSEYGDPGCYRYPLDTEARCKAAWSYVNQEKNKSELGSKWSSVRGKIKRYAKEHYNLDLKSDAEASDDSIESTETIGDQMEIKELEAKIAEQTQTIEDTKTQLASAIAEKETLSNEKAELEKRVEELSQFKATVEAERETARILSERKQLVIEAGVELDLGDAEAEKWTQMDSDMFVFILEKMKSLKASSAKKDDDSDATAGKTDVPPLGRDSQSGRSAKDLAREYLHQGQK